MISGDKRILQRALKENCEMLFKPRLYISNGYSFTRKYSFEEMKFEVVSDTFNTGVVEGERKPVYVWKLELYPRGTFYIY